MTEEMAKYHAERILIPGYGCLRCGHQWVPQAKHRPKRCPKCSSPGWDTHKVGRWPKMRKQEELP